MLDTRAIIQYTEWTSPLLGESRVRVLSLGELETGNLIRALGGHQCKSLRRPRLHSRSSTKVYLPAQLLAGLKADTRWAQEMCRHHSWSGVSGPCMGQGR